MGTAPAPAGGGNAICSKMDVAPYQD